VGSREARESYSRTLADEYRVGNQIQPWVDSKQSISNTGRVQDNGEENVNSQEAEHAAIGSCSWGDGVS